MRVQTGDNVGIGGFIITGMTPKHVVLRALGPSLKQFGVSGPLADPILEVYNSENVLVAQNDNWKDDPVQKAFLEAEKLAPTDDLESALDIMELPAGSYTAVVRGKSDTSGIGLIEVYDLDQSGDSKLANISTRAFVETGSNIVIAGFVLRSDRADDRIAVRGLGPSLEEHAVSNPLKDPHLELRNSNGALLLANDDWGDNKAQAAELQEEGLQPRHSFESAIIASLPSGSYTALLSGLDNGTGVGLIEVYDLGLAPASTVPYVKRMQAGAWNAIEKQHVRFDAPQFSRSFTISVYKPSTINKSDIGSRAALQGETAPIPFTASADDIEAALLEIPRYYAYGQFGNLELDEGSFDYFASVGAINREPIVILDVEGGTAASGFTIEFGSLVGGERKYNTWVAGMPLVTIEIR